MAAAEEKPPIRAHGEDAFSFALTEEEFLDILFDDLELPDLVKASLKDATLSEYRRAGYSNDGTTPNLNVLRTMRYSMSRRLALRRPSTDEVRRLEEELNELRAKDTPDLGERKRIPKLFGDIERLKRLQRAIPFIDPIDVRYNRFARVAMPRAKAVMFCLMDVSASMGEREKDLAKRFFILLHLFLKRKYERVDIVFIRHTHEASEVDEQEFFYGRNRAAPSSVRRLKEMIEIREKRYPAADWNIYCAQASDGDNSGNDTGGCVELLTRDDPADRRNISPISRSPIAARAEIGAAMSGKELWRGYAKVAETARQFRHEAGCGTRRHLSGLPRTVRQTERARERDR